MKQFNHWLGALCLLLLLKAGLIGYLILYSGIGLGPDEAQYWTWSQSLDWGYYSKPPAIAWQIWVGTQLFGNTELGVRFMAIVLGTLLSLAVYWLARVCRLQPQTAFWSGVIMALTPLGMMGSLLAITDGGMVLCWTLACIGVAVALRDRIAPDYYLLGLVILCGALFKWPIYLFWGLLLLFMPFYRSLVNIHFIGGVAVSMLGLLPSIIWNWSHQWATFRHVSSTIAGGQPKIEIGAFYMRSNVLEFIGSQGVLLSPILFIMLLLAGWRLFRQRKEVSPALLFCGVSCFIIMVSFMTLAMFQKIQGNWCDFSYPSGIVLLCWYACEATVSGKSWLKAGVTLSMVLCAIILSMPHVQAHALWSSYPISYKINPFRHNLGWERLSPELMAAGYDPKQHFLFGDKYQMSSILSFYGPEQNRAYFFNIHGIRKNQFSFWPSMAQEQIGKTGFFVLAENTPHLQQGLEERIAFYQQTLSLYFDEVQFLDVKKLFQSYDHLAKGALIFKCIGYNGKEPTHQDSY